MKSLLSSRFVVYTLVFFFALATGCSEAPQRIEINPAFGAYITGYTSGVISKHDVIQIKLANAANLANNQGEIDKNLFDFSPSVEGTVFLINEQTIEFRPSEALEENTLYTVDFELSEVVQVPEELRTFTFQFQTLQQDFRFYSVGLSPQEDNQLENQLYTGKIVTADQADTSAITELILLSGATEGVTIEWNFLSATEYQFTLKNIKRQKEATTFTIHINGDAINVDREEEFLVEVPSINDFVVSKIEVVQVPTQHIEIRFSDQLKKQDLNGLIAIRGAQSLQFVQQKNVVKVYPNKRLVGTNTLTISQGIKNIYDSRLKQSVTKDLSFAQTKPAVKMVGDGVILPNSNGLIIPFEAVSLQYVDVVVKRIFENNVLQFLQNNQLEGDYSLHRVARVVKYQRINLAEFGKSDLHAWNRFHLDLSQILTTEPGAIYRVEIRFKRAYSLYQCEGVTEENQVNQLTTEPDNNWDGAPDLADYEEYYYNWRERDNPCSRAYYAQNYGHSITARNVIASDIGLIAKLGGDRTLHVIASNLVSTQPIEGATIEFFDYQQQLISTASTDKEGMVTQTLSRKPYVVVASHNNQKAYLKVDDGGALSLSKFDVAGNQVEEGVKGFLYAERGVWRPGDSLYLSFILEDKEQLLPINHPVQFELYNPKNQLIYREVAIENTNGFYDFRTATETDALTGYYSAVVKVGNRKFRKALRIETVKPNRLKIYIDFNGETIYSSKNAVEGTLSAKWLHGAKAGDLKAKVDLTLTEGSTTFDRFSQFQFSDPSREFTSQTKTIFDGHLDGDGKTTLPFDLKTTNSPGKLRANFDTKVFEPGGNFSVDRYSIEYSPYPFYVGLNVPQGTLNNGTLLTDYKHVIDIQTLTEKGEKAPHRKVEIEVYKIQWRWWWESENSNIGNYISQQSIVPIQQQTIVTNESGSGSYPFEIKQPEWGRFLIRVKDVESGHSAGKVVYVDWPYWARANRKSSENATMLGFSTDKDKYDVNQEVSITFPSAADGRALLSIENGTKVLEKFWVETEEGETQFSFETTEEMAPNAFVHITLLQPHQTTLNDHPIRMYGVIPLLVENPESHLFPEIETEKVFRPESNTTIRVKEKSGRKMTYTLAIVDEGLLDLTLFATPDAWQHFYSREALGVKTWDVYDYVMGAYGGEIDKLIAVGGDGALGKKKDRKANRFKPMVTFLGPFTYTGGVDKHTIKIPNYVGSVRAMVVAGDQSAYGKTDKAIPVRNPLMVLATLPRVLSPGEIIEVPVNVFAMEEKVKSAQVKIEVNNALEIVGTDHQNVKFSSKTDKVVTFKLKVKEKIGFASVKVTASGAGEKAHDQIELEVRAPNPYIYQVTDTMIAPGKTAKIAFQKMGVEGTNSTGIEFSNFPSLGLENRLNYLIRYPHGCIEQTVSAVFPQLFLDQLTELSTLQKEKLTKNIQNGLNRLLSFQTNSGGFAYWPGNSSTNEWGTNYAGHFFLEAEKQGYSLPLNLKSNWLSYQQSLARDWGNISEINSRDEQLIQAYRLFTLALAKQPELGAMNRLRENQSMSPEAIWKLASAYVLAGQKDAAKQLVAALPKQVEPYFETGRTYRSTTRDEALILETLVLLKENQEAIGLAKVLAERLQSNQWMSTQTTGYTLLAIAKFYGSYHQTKSLDFNYKWPLASEKVSTEVPIYTLTATDQELPKSTQIEIENTGESPLFVRLTQSGIPITDQRVAAQENLNFRVRYLTMNGEELDPTRLPQGTDFIAEVKVNNPGRRGNYTEMMINQLFPSGWEIINARMLSGGGISQQDVPEYQDIRDDRVYTYFDLKRYQTKVFRIQLNATYLGKYYLPVVSAEAMYDRSINARTNGKWVEVIEQD